MEISFEKVLSAVTLLLQGLTRCVATTMCRRHKVFPSQCVSATMCRRHSVSRHNVSPLQRVTPQPGHCLTGDLEGKK